MSTRGRTRRDCCLWSQNEECKPTEHCQIQGECLRQGEKNAITVIPTSEVTAATKPWAGTGYYCLHLPGSLSSLALTRDISPGAIPLGEWNSPESGERRNSDCSNFPQVSLQQALPKHPNCGFHTSLPSPTEKVSPNKPLLPPPLVWAGNWHQRVGYKQRWVQNQSGAAAAKKRKGMRSCSRRCSRLNLSQLAWNRGLWGQVQAGVRPDLSLSWRHRALSRFRDLPRNIRGLSEKADWLVLPVWRGQQRTQEDILLTTTLYIFFFFFLFCIVLIFFFISPLILIFNLFFPFFKNIFLLNKLFFLFLQYSIVILHSFHVFDFVFLLV